MRCVAQKTTKVVLWFCIRSMRTNSMYVDCSYEHFQRKQYLPNLYKNIKSTKYYLQYLHYTYVVL